MDQPRGCTWRLRISRPWERDARADLDGQWLRVSLIVEAGAKLAQAGVNVRLVSFPSWELFKAQGQGYQDSVLLPKVNKRIAIEAGVSQGWERWTGERGSTISIERFGASSPYQTIYEKLA